ncbi:MAG: uracil-DNA glycosylase [Lachnospiraceae bacterium]|nr:uracil-DNA glycosylase [Lachnospiraceae bacterium]
MKWSEILPKDSLDLCAALTERTTKERNEGRIIYPLQGQIFRALNETPPDKVKVCIVGQDPYHSPLAANGLAFSITDGCPLQPSLKNIFKELKNDLGIETPKSGDLTPWAERGVLLLNTTLTVYEHQPNSCADWGWDKFTKAVLRSAHSLPQPIIFLLWGASAQALLDDLITCAAVYHDNNHIVKENLVKKAFVLSSHPSPLSCGRPCKGTPAFKGSKPFSTTNRLLEEMGSTPIDWRL